MPSHELDQFLNAWEQQARFIVRIMESLPEGKYDFRVAPEHRSLGEMAWHLAEIDGYLSYGIERGALNFTDKPPGIERPKDLAGLLKGYERVYADARARILGLRPEDLGRTITSFDGSPTSIREVLWNAMLHHSIHHLGQLALMCRLAGGTPPGIYGPNREEMAAMRAAMAGKAGS